MREIKFRAWDKDGERLVGWEEIHDQWGIEYLNDGLADVMQYTSLKDKNGVEIYEGDILGGDHVRGGYQVIWNEHKVAFDVEGGAGYLRPWLAGFTLGLEVIGNIYENPDLLNTTSKNAYASV